MLFKYIAGNSVQKALQCAHSCAKQSRIPIINYVTEHSKDKQKTYNEHIKIADCLPCHYKIAIKLSAFDFNENMISDVVRLFVHKNIQIVIDAEENENHECYKSLTNKLLYSYNYDYPYIVKTYQLYRKDALNDIIHDMNYCDKHGVILGTKIVRGAYWNSEYHLGHLYTQKHLCDHNYNSAIMQLAMSNTNTYNILATHNTFSMHLGSTFNTHLSKAKFDFAHLMGMKHVEYDNMIKQKQSNQNVHVYIPYGEYNEMLPYLIRRLYENADVIKYML